MGSTEVTARFLRALMMQVQANGIDAAALLREADVPLDAVMDPSRRIGHGPFLAAWRLASERTADPLIGLHALEPCRVAFMGLEARRSDYVVLHLLVNSATVEAGLRRYARHYALTLDGADVDVARTPRGELEVQWSFRSGPLHAPPQLVEHAVGLMIALIHYATRGAVTPCEVFFAHASPGGAESERVAILGAPVRHGAGGSGFRLTAEGATNPLVTSHPALLQLVEEEATQTLQRLEREAAPRGSALVGQVREILRTEILRLPTAAQVAERTGMSVRTLSRRLRDHDTSYQDLLDEVRRELALELLRDDNVAVTEVAQRLGFAETSAFDRAFRRWLGEPPSVYRARIASA